MKIWSFLGYSMKYNIMYTYSIYIGYFNYKVKMKQNRKQLTETQHEVKCLKSKAVSV